MRSIVSEINPKRNCFYFSRPAAATRYQNTLVQASLSVSPMQRGSSVINSDSTKRKAGITDFVLCATV